MSNETINCSSGAEGDYDMGLHIAAIFVIFAAAALGVLSPILTSRFPQFVVLQRLFFVAKFFGAGVIITTGIVRSLTLAHSVRHDPHLPRSS